MRRKSLPLLLILMILAARTERVSWGAVQDAPPTKSASAEQAAVPGGLDQADLQDMLGPIALYPDELLANVLTASIYPDELQAANTFVTGGGDPAKIAAQGWESSVNAIARIPDVLAFLTENIDWTTAIGQAYIVQSTDVMAAIQALRAKANANGALKTTPEQTVIQDGSTIIIEPADPEVIYVPSYQPQVVYASSPPVYVDDDDDELLAGVVGFGVGLAVGACFDDDFDCDWDNDCVGWGGGHNDIEIERNTNIETGDINIGSGNTIQGGDRQGGDRTNVRGGDRTNNNVGREGTKWEPNSKKVDTNKIKSGGASQLQNYKGVSQNPGARASQVPNRATSNSGRASPAALSADSARSRAGAAGNSSRAPSAGDRATPSAGNRASPSSGNRASPSAGNRASPSAGNRASPSARPPTPKKPAPKAPSASSRSTPSKNKPSGFSPDRGSGKSSARGSSSRGGGGSRSGGARSGGGGGRGGGGGGGRGGRR